MAKVCFICDPQLLVVSGCQQPRRFVDGPRLLQRAWLVKQCNELSSLRM